MLIIVLVLYLPKNFHSALATKDNSGITSASRVTQSVDTGSYFFRLKAHYGYRDERINFDIVVGCSVRVTRYRGGDSGFLAARYPRFFVHRTRDGHAVMQIVPIACRGETTESGIVPKDFLPGVIWFEKYGDYRFGIAYVSEDAFESPNGKLSFQGASVHRATFKEWKAFRERAAGNEGMRKRYYDRPYYWTPEAQRIASSGGKEIESAYARGCTGVRRYKLSEPVGRRLENTGRPTGPGTGRPKPETMGRGRNFKSWSNASRYSTTDFVTYSISLEVIIIMVDFRPGRAVGCFIVDPFGLYLPKYFPCGRIGGSLGCLKSVSRDQST